MAFEDASLIPLASYLEKVKYNGYIVTSYALWDERYFLSNSVLQKLRKNGYTEERWSKWYHSC